MLKMDKFWTFLKGNPSIGSQVIYYYLQFVNVNIGLKVREWHGFFWTVNYDD